MKPSHDQITKVAQIFQSGWMPKLPLPQILTEAQIDSVLGVADVEWRAVVVVGRSTGRSLREVSMLRQGDIDHTKGFIHFLNQKLRRTTRVYMPTWVSKHLPPPGAHQDPSSPLFPNLFETALSNPGRLGSSFKAMQRKAGLRPWNFCALRKTFVTRLADMGVPIHVVSEIAGYHTSTVRRTLLGK